MHSKRLLPIFIGLLLCISGALGGFAYFELATPKYMARITVSPPPDSNTNQQVSGSLGILAGLAGGNETSDVHSQFLFQLTSYENAEKLLHDPVIVKGIADRKRLTQPTTDAVQSYITNVLKFDRPRGGLLEKSPLTTLIINDRDPSFATYLLAKTINTSDTLLRSRRMVELLARRNKIVDTLRTVTTAEYREALIRLLAQVERERLFAGVDKNYGFRIIDPLFQSSKPVEPTLFFSVGIGFFLGFMAAMIGLLLWFIRITVLPGRND